MQCPLLQYTVLIGLIIYFNGIIYLYFLTNKNLNFLINSSIVIPSASFDHRIASTFVPSISVTATSAFSEFYVKESGDAENILIKISKEMVELKKKKSDQRKRLFENKKKIYESFYGMIAPEAECPNLVRIGQIGDGGKWICNPFILSKLQRPCIFYSMGLNNEVSFDIELMDITKNQCKHIAIDKDKQLPNITQSLPHSNFLTAKITNRKNETFHEFTLNDIMIKYNTSKIDIMKMDIEGSEYGVINQLTKINMCQLLIELHTIKRNYKKFYRWLNTMSKAGFYLLHFEINEGTFQACEFTLIHESCFEDYDYRMHRFRPAEPGWKKYVKQFPIWDKIEAASKEYTNDLASLILQKWDIIKILTTHRPLKIGEYQYGLSQSLKKDSRLIVFEWTDNKRKVREYTQHSSASAKSWDCCECERLCKRKLQKLSSRLYLIGGAVFVPINHQCEAKDYKTVEKCQNLLKAKTVTEAKRMVQTVDFSYKEHSSTSEKNADNNNPTVEKPLNEAIFDEIIASPTQYTIENVEALLANKKKLLANLKIFRPIKLGNYEYGLNEKLEQNRRLIVYEWDDNKRKVREYSLSNRYLNRAECCKCHRLFQQKLRIGSTYCCLMNGMVLVPIKHDCPARDYEPVMKYHKHLKDGNVKEAQRISRMINFDYVEDSEMDTVAATDKASTSSTTLDQKASTVLKRKADESDSSSSIEEPPVTKKLKNESGKNTSDENSSCPSNGQKLKSTPKTKKECSPSSETKTYEFTKPSTSTLKEICSKLDIEYCKEAKAFWKGINFKEINPQSSNIVSQNYKTKNFYKILSILFTGKYNDYEQIYYAINSAFRDKLIEDGKLPVDDINLLISDYTVTDRHFKFIAKFLSCRLFIFDRDNNEVKKYGKWKEANNNDATLVISFSNGKYSIVLYS